MKKEFANVLFANIVFLLVNVLINFLIPKFVSIDTYSLIKTYALYISYAGLLHFGYNDGMYLKYGGKKIEEIEKVDLSNNFLNYVLLNSLMFIIIFVIGLVLGNQILIAFAFGMLSCNVMNYLKSLYQATGKFKLYGIALNVDRICVFILSILALFALKSDNYLVFIWIQVLTSIGCTVALTIDLERKLHFLKYGRFKISEYVNNISSGFVLLLGNFSNSFFTTMDRWFVKVLLSSFDFAMYSLAASMENIISVIVSPITVTMYNSFCKNQSKEYIIKAKNIALLYGFFVLIIAYPVRFILEHFLVNYISAIEIVFLLFGTQLFYVVIKGIYVNLYKAQKRQKAYFLQLICMIIVGFALNVALYIPLKNNISIACATFITSIIWFIICETIDKSLAYSYKKYIAIIIICISYLVTGFMMSSLLGLVVYLLIMSAVSIIFMNSEVKYVYKIVKNKIKKSKE